MNATIHVVVKKFLMNVFEAKVYMNFFNKHETFEKHTISKNQAPILNFTK